jgi:predicted transglutaminase-like cysteine proteinase
MLRCVAALCCAVLIVVWPGNAGSDTDTFWNAPWAAVPAPAFATPRAQIVTAADAKSHSQSGAKSGANSDLKSGLKPSETKAEAPIQKASPDDGSATLAARTPIEPAMPLALPPPVAEPFGLAANAVAAGDVLTKWSGVEAAIRAEDEIFARCRNDAQSCPRAARNFLAIVAQGRAQTGLARIGIINRAVNMAIEPMSDMAQWGVPDRWSAPLETFTTGRGDCEDYAIAKYVALTAAGVPAPDVKLVIVRNIAANEDHAVVAVRHGGDWIVLDNRWLMLVKDSAVQKAIPLFVLDDDGVRRFAAPALVAARRAAAPASF